MNKISKLLYIIKNRDKIHEAIKKNECFYFELKNNKIYNENKRLFYIGVNRELSGFFTIFRTIVSALYVSDCLGFTPYIEVLKSKYNVPGGYKGKNNMWEYYFKNNELDDNANILLYNEKHAQLVYDTFFDEKNIYPNGYNINEKYILEMGKIIKKYVKFNEETENYLKQELKKISLNDNVVGIHYRGTDYNLGLNAHPKVTDIKQYFDIMDKMIKENDKTSFFIATDDTNILNNFLNRYKDRIKYYDDVIRSSDNCGVHFKNNERKDSQYYLGLEVIRDMYTLANCESIICGLSQVSFSARMYKYSFGNDYKEKYIINNGLVNSSNKLEKMKREK